MVRGTGVRIWAGMAALAVVLTACGGGDSTAPVDEVGLVELSPTVVLLTEVGGSIPLTVSVRDADGGVLPLSVLEWRVVPANVASVDVPSRRIIANEAGVARVIASAGEKADTIEVEVYLDPNTGPFLPGVQYFGRNDYVEYEPGELPLILSAPHGGYLNPAEIPERTFGVTGQDLRTQELTRALADAIEARSGRRPHVIISLLHRRRLDPNREIVEAAQGNVFAEQAWEEFQGFIELASETVEDDFGSGLYIDMHGHGHEIQRLELGYLLEAVDLDLPDQTLSSSNFVNESSLRTLAGEVAIPFSDLIRGPTSLGALLVQRGYPSVPSPSDPTPGSAPYFTGGYNTARHGSSSGGPISGLQIEHHYGGVRQTEQDRATYSAALAEALEVFLLTHYGYDWTAGGG